MSPAPATHLGAHRMNSNEWGVLLILALIWGSSFYFIKMGLNWVDTIPLVWMRVTVAGVILAGAAWLKGVAWWPNRQRLGPYVVMALLNNVAPFLLIVWAEKTIHTSQAAILNATTPLWGVVLAHFLTDDEKLTPSRAIGVLVSFVGVVIIVGPANLLGLSDEVVPSLAVLLASSCYACGAVYGRRYKKDSPLVPATGQVWMASLILLPVMLVMSPPWNFAAPSFGPVASIAALAIVCTAFAYMMLFWLLARAGASNVMLVTFLIPITAMILGAVLLDEAIGLQKIAGMALIGCGLAFVDGRIPEKLGLLPKQPSLADGPASETAGDRPHAEPICTEALGAAALVENDDDLLLGRSQE